MRIYPPRRSRPAAWGHRFHDPLEQSSATAACRKNGRVDRSLPTRKTQSAWPRPREPGPNLPDRSLSSAASVRTNRPLGRCPWRKIHRSPVCVRQRRSGGTTTTTRVLPVNSRLRSIALLCSRRSSLSPNMIVKKCECPVAAFFFPPLLLAPAPWRPAELGNRPPDPDDPLVPHYRATLSLLFPHPFPPSLFARMFRHSHLLKSIYELVCPDRSSIVRSLSEPLGATLSGKDWRRRPVIGRPLDLDGVARQRFRVEVGSPQKSTTRLPAALTDLPKKPAARRSRPPDRSLATRGWLPARILRCAKFSLWDRPSGRRPWCAEWTRPGWTADLEAALSATMASKARAHVSVLRGIAAAGRRFLCLLAASNRRRIARAHVQTPNGRSRRRHPASGKSLPLRARISSWVIGRMWLRNKFFQRCFSIASAAAFRRGEMA